MKQYFLIMIFLPLFGTSQNLISNGSFEDTVACPATCALLENAIGWIDPMVPVYSSADLIHICSPVCDYDYHGYQLPRTGLAHGGITVGHITSNIREYIETEIINPLIAGECYQISFYISAGNYRYTTDDIQVYFSDTLIDDYPFFANLNYSPQVSNTTGNFPDTTNWTLVQAEYQAHGGENYIIIGNFYDTTGTTMVLSNPTGGSGFAYIFVDDVSLTHVICTGVNEIENIPVQIFPNPASDKIEIKIDSIELFELEIFNSEFKLCSKTKLSIYSTIDLSQLTSGIYFYKIFNNINNSIGKFVVY